MKLNPKFKFGIRVFALCMIVFTVGFAVLNPTLFFTKIETTTYGDGCKETYVNGVLNSSPCQSAQQTYGIKNPIPISSNFS